MRIVCGTDFSPAAAEAAEVAAHLAHRTGSTLHLVHAVLPPWEPTGPVTPPPGEAYPLEQATLTEEAHRIGADGLHITTEVTAGAPDEVVTAAAGREGAHLVVLGATGHRAVDRWLLGSTAARAARESHVPVLVVRQPEGLHAWLDGKRPLRVLVGVEPGPSSDAALR
ncbi:MAG TPA: universal stress protein [Gemmatimonadales bacterium]|nr:universal stress protein [Gemmatimonadales bacterium]